MIREALSDLRDIINASTGASRTLDEALAELRLETAERLSAAGLQLDWTVEGETLADLPADRLHAVRSIVREAISNIIRHADASVATLRINCGKTDIHVQIRDDGKGFNALDTGSGFGLTSMQARVEALGGDFALMPSPSGTVITARFPLKAKSAVASTAPPVGSSPASILH